MHEATRTKAAKLIRAYRRHIQRYERDAVRRTGIDAEHARRMAARYRTLLDGARDMLDTLTR